MQLDDSAVADSLKTGLPKSFARLDHQTGSIIKPGIPEEARLGLDSLVNSALTPIHRTLNSLWLPVSQREERGIDQMGPKVDKTAAGMLKIELHHRAQLLFFKLLPEPLKAPPETALMVDKHAAGIPGGGQDPPRGPHGYGKRLFDPQDPASRIQSCERHLLPVGRKGTNTHPIRLLPLQHLPVIREAADTGKLAAKVRHVLRVAARRGNQVHPGQIPESAGMGVADGIVSAAGGIAGTTADDCRSEGVHAGENCVDLFPRQRE